MRFGRFWRVCLPVPRGPPRGPPRGLPRHLPRGLPQDLPRGLPRGLARGAAAFSLLSKITSSLKKSMPAPSTASGVSSSSWAGPMSSSPLQHCGHRSHFGSRYTLGSCCKAGLVYFSMSQTSKTHSFHLDNHLLCLVPKLVTTRCSAPVLLKP